MNNTVHSPLIIDEELALSWPRSMNLLMPLFTLILPPFTLKEVGSIAFSLLPSLLD